ncbi:hypothetical protein [Vagococcus teuberi]
MTVTFSYATRQDLPKIIEIYNQAVPTRISTADTNPVTVEAKKFGLSLIIKRHDHYG